MWPAMEVRAGSLKPPSSMALTQENNARGSRSIAAGGLPGRGRSPPAHDAARPASLSDTPTTAIFL